jgi:uroporphyrinogen decarboxylase
MTPRERILATLAGEPTDRPPISFWGHVYDRESTAADLVAHTLERWQRHRWDWVKLNPRKHYHVEPWGVRYDYSRVPESKPFVAQYPVHMLADWDAIDEQPHDAGALGEQLEAVRALRAALPADVPLLQTVFTPIAILAECTEPPEALRDALKTDAARIRRALEAVTRTYERYVSAIMQAGADGIYLATVDWGSRSFVTPELLREWSRPYDLRLLAAAGASPYHMLHVCQRDALLFEFADYPVGSFSWDSTSSDNPSLADGLARLKGAVVGGLGHETDLQRGEDAALEAYRRAYAQTGGRRWLCAPGCSMPPQTPDSTLSALRNEVERATVASRRP